MKFEPPGGPHEKWIRLSSVRVLLLKACSGVLAHIEKKYLLHCSCVDFARNDHTAQLNGPFTRERLQGMMRGRNCYANDELLLSVVTFTDRSLGFVERCDLTRISVLCTEMVNRAIFDGKGGG